MGTPENWRKSVETNPGQTTEVPGGERERAPPGLNSEHRFRALKLKNRLEQVNILLRLAGILSYQRHQRLTVANTTAVDISTLKCLKAKMKKATWSSGFLTQ